MKIKINKQKIAILVFLIATCFRWFFIGIFGGIRIQILLLLGSIFLLLVQGRFRKNMLRLSSIWLLYGFSICFNLYYKGIHSQSTTLYAIMLLEILAVLCFLDAPLDIYESSVKFLVVYGGINAIFVLLHFALGDTFTSIYYHFLNSDAQTLADNYVQLGHYFGFFYMPADPAGLIAYTIVFVLFGYFVLSDRKNYKKVYFPIIAVFFVALILTGKKGVLFCSIAAFSLVMLLIYASKNQWIKVLRYIVAVSLVLLVGYIYIITNADNPVIARLNEFFTNISTGERYDSYRSVLYGYALSQWQSNKLFGIGWRQFSRLTVSVYGMASGHEVNRDYLQLLCETGLVGLTLTLIPLIVTLRRMVYVMRRMTREKGLRQHYRVISFAGFIQLFFVLYAFMEIPFYDYTFFAVYILSCAIINRAYGEVKRKCTVSLADLPYTN